MTARLDYYGLAPRSAAALVQLSGTAGGSLDKCLKERRGRR